MLTDIQSYELKLEKRVDETDDSAVGQKKKTPNKYKTDFVLKLDEKFPTPKKPTYSMGGQLVYKNQAALDDAFCWKIKSFYPLHLLDSIPEDPSLLAFNLMNKGQEGFALTQPIPQSKGGNKGNRLGKPLLLWILMKLYGSFVYDNESLGHLLKFLEMNGRSRPLAELLHAWGITRKQDDYYHKVAGGVPFLVGVMCLQIVTVLDVVNHCV